MSLKEKYQKQIDFFDRKAKFYQSLLIALFSGVVWSIYAIIESKASDKIVILLGIGVILIVFISLKIKTIDNEQEELIDKLGDV